MKQITLILLVAIFCSCSTLFRSNSKNYDGNSPALSKKDITNWNIMTGRWYGHSLLKDGSKREWIVDRTINGQYSIDFYTTDKDGSVDKQTESGEWGMSGNVYFTIFKSFSMDGIIDSTDLSDPYIRDAYKILKLDDKTFEYKYIRTGEKFKMQKVSPDFKLEGLNLKCSDI